MLCVGLRGFLSVVLGMHSMAVCYKRMMRSFFSRAGFVVFGRFTMVLRGRRMMLGSALMVLCNFGCGRSHGIFPSQNLPNLRARTLPTTHDNLVTRPCDRSSIFSGDVSSY